MNETARLKGLLDTAMARKNEKNIKYEEFSDLEEKYYVQSNIIEGLKSDNAKLVEHIRQLQVDKTNQEVAREVRQTGLTGAAIGKGGYRHFMLKEIYE